MTLAELAYKISAVDSNDENDLVIQELSQVYYMLSAFSKPLAASIAPGTFSLRLSHGSEFGEQSWTVCAKRTGVLAICAEGGARSRRSRRDSRRGSGVIPSNRKLPKR